MSKIFNLLFLVLTFSLSAQSQIQFDKKFIESENQWVAFQADNNGAHNFGFIYIDPEAGLTFDFEGTFKIDENGTFIPSTREKTSSAKFRLEPNTTLVAFIPETKLPELHVDKVPEWLKLYKVKEGSVKQLYNLGFMYNAWNECAKALEYLEKANKIDPKYKGLQVEMAYSYNCLQQYQKAVDVLKIALKSDPLDAYTNKELIYAEVKNNHLEDAKKVFFKVVKECKDKTYNNENAYNILHGYYTNKDLKSFNSWLAEADVYINGDQNLKSLATQMKAQLEQ